MLSVMDLLVCLRRDGVVCHIYLDTFLTMAPAGAKLPHIAR